jgi:hypothetical protein
MAKSPAHKFGQIIGDLLEEIMADQLQAFCDTRKLYLDKKGIRGGARPGSKVTWEDHFGNLHDLDFVIEQGGSKDHRGRPLAFIEVAWRRYTKHSRNKAQEVQGALLPIAEKYTSDKPFLGAVLAGVFTSSAMEQMKSSGFEVMLFPYKTILNAFNSAGIDAAFDESTPEASFESKVRSIEALTSGQRQDLKNKLVRANQTPLKQFLGKLSMSLDRRVTKVLILPLYGHQNTFRSLNMARRFIQNYDEQSAGTGTFRKYEIIVRYSNDDEIKASLGGKAEVMAFLIYIEKSHE